MRKHADSGNMVDMDTDAISTEQAAQILGIPARTVRYQARAGKLPVIYKGTGGVTSAYVFRREDIQQIAEGRRKDTRRSPQPPKAVA